MCMESQSTMGSFKLQCLLNFRKYDAIIILLLIILIIFVPC